MTQIKFNKSRVLIVTAFIIVVLIVLSVYMYRINIFHDLSIEPRDAKFKKTNPELVLVTPFNRKFPLQLNNQGAWETHYSYLNKIYLKTGKDVVDDKELTLSVNNQDVILDENGRKKIENDDYMLIELPLASKGNAIDKLNYVLQANAKFVKGKSTGKWVLLGIYGLGLLFLLFVFLLNSDSQHRIFKRINIFLGISKFEWVQRNTGMEILVFFVLWLTIILWMI